MTDNGDSPEVGDETKIVTGQINGLVSTDNGNFYTGRTNFSLNSSPDDIREGLSAIHGVEPSQIILGDREIEQRAGRTAVGFSKWNSSWVPGIDKDKVDPTLN